MRQFTDPETVVMSFHLIWKKGQPSKKTGRCLESIFWHHPQAQVCCLLYTQTSSMNSKLTGQGEDDDEVPQNRDF